MESTAVRKRRKSFLVNYGGLWLGGTAVVIAESAEQAREMVKQHKDTVNFVDVKVAEVRPANETSIVWNWNGDY